MPPPPPARCAGSRRVDRADRARRPDLRAHPLRDGAPARGRRRLRQRPLPHHLVRLRGRAFGRLRLYSAIGGRAVGRVRGEGRSRPRMRLWPSCSPPLRAVDAGAHRRRAGPGGARPRRRRAGVRRPGPPEPERRSSATRWSRAGRAAAERRSRASTPAGTRPGSRSGPRSGLASTGRGGSGCGSGGRRGGAWASLGLVSGASLLTVSHGLGHASTEVTERFYLHRVHGLKDQVVDFLPAFS
jgi:hypothetical protein